MASISSGVMVIDGPGDGANTSTSPADGTTAAESVGASAGGGTMALVEEVSAMHAALRSVTGVGSEVIWREPCPGSGWNTPTS